MSEFVSSTSNWLYEFVYGFYIMNIKIGKKHFFLTKLSKNEIEKQKSLAIRQSMTERNWIQLQNQNDIKTYRHFGTKDRVAMATSIQQPSVQFPWQTFPGYCVSNIV